ncbi:hypothetical protein ACQP1G_16805 [Nocardia sp. CA-107356]|uniref:hypothetical protein n=1 Tax=Nocardia sp. CA-107356 TaxID=3239972 RepID=UPI003D92DE81
MIESEENTRDLAGLVAPRSGRLIATGEDSEPYRLLDSSGVVVDAAAVFLRELLAAGRPAPTLRSYGMDLLRWWRFYRPSMSAGTARLGSKLAISAAGFS